MTASEKVGMGTLGEELCGHMIEKMVLGEAK
jgi:hypothetical protein